jgi:predicted nucleic acid-binding protein
MKKLVIDSFVFLAYLRREKGYRKFKRLLQEAKVGKTRLFFCWLNLGEVYYQVWRKRSQEDARRALSLIRKLPLELVSVTDDLVLEAMEIKALFPVALADCFVAALAKRESAPILTGDPEFKELGSLVAIEWLR